MFHILCISILTGIGSDNLAGGLGWRGCRRNSRKLGSDQKHAGNTQHDPFDLISCPGDTIPRCGYWNLCSDRHWWGSSHSRGFSSLLLQTQLILGVVMTCNKYISILNWKKLLQTFTSGRWVAMHSTCVCWLVYNPAHMSTDQTQWLRVLKRSSVSSWVQDASLVLPDSPSGNC